MTDQPSQIEWYLARDGQQYGPLSEHEMRAFVDLGHLRPDDLIWRAGFPEWRAATDVFAIHVTAPPKLAPQPAVAAFEPALDDLNPSPADLVAAPTEVAPAKPTPASPDPAAHAAATATAAGPIAAAAADWHVPAAPAAEPRFDARHEVELTSPDQLFAAMAPAAAAAPVAEPSISLHVEPVPVTAVATPHPRPRPQPAAIQSHQPAQAPQGGPLDARPSPGPVRPERAGPRQGAATRPQSRAVQPVLDRRSARYDDAVDDDLDDATPRRRLGAGRIAAALAFALVIGGGMAAVLKRDLLTGLLPAGIASVSLSTSGAPAAPIVSAGASAESVEQSFQRSAIWRHIKLEFPEWYADRVQEAAKFAAEKRGEGAISKHLTEALVALRRKHADQALAASGERLRFVATAFLDNLQALSKKNVGTCYGFISQGETFPAVLEMMQKPDGSAILQKQVIAVFEAIADGRRAPQSYLSPRKSDYDALAVELNTRGWTEDDLRTFSDPRALGRASPEQVCRMVQDWFAAQIAIKDQDAQSRLLVESLRPVVAG